MADFPNQVCDVCRLLDNNLELQICSYCAACKSWICDSDLRNGIRRAKAALLAAKEKISN